MRLRKIFPFLCLILLGLFPRLSLADLSHTTIWDFDEDVTSVVPHEDGFIVLAGTQLWFCDPSLEQPEPQLLFENDSLRQMLSDGQGNLYAFADMMHQGAWSNVLAEVSLSTQTLTPMLVLDNLPSVGDSAVLQTENGPMLVWVSASSPYNDLFFCDLSSQKKDTWYGKSIQALATDGRRCSSAPLLAACIQKMETNGNSRRALHFRPPSAAFATTRISSAFV